MTKFKLSSHLSSSRITAKYKVTIVLSAMFPGRKNPSKSISLSQRFLAFDWRDSDFNPSQKTSKTDVYNFLFHLLKIKQFISGMCRKVFQKDSSSEGRMGPTESLPYLVVEGTRNISDHLLLVDEKRLFIPKQHEIYQQTD